MVDAEHAVTDPLAEHDDVCSLNALATARIGHNLCEESSQLRRVALALLEEGSVYCICREPARP